MPKRKPKTRTFTDELRESILAAPISRYRISVLSGVDAGTISRFLSRKRGMGLDSLDRIAAVLEWHLTPRKES